jgi:hypothetical protein
MPADQIAYPEWTDYRDKSGLDPLGMQNSSINLYQRLLPGISNVTLRMRYYGLYAWLAAVYARHWRNTDIRKWQQLIRRAEALYALAAVHGGDDAGVAGSRWARRKLAASTGRISFAEHADPDESAPLISNRNGAPMALPTAVRSSKSVFLHKPKNMTFRYRAPKSVTTWRSLSKERSAMRRITTISRSSAVPRRAKTSTNLRTLSPRPSGEQAPNDGSMIPLPYHIDLTM